MNAQSGSSDKIQSRTLREVIRPFERRVLWALIYYNVVLGAGTVGYKFIEGWSWMDALYMSVITATSVGFQEVHPLTDPGRAFTMVFLVFSVIGLGLLWALVTALLIELDFGGVFRRKRMSNRIESLSGHYIICGGGRMGRVVADEMKLAQRDFVLLELDAERIEAIKASGHPDLISIEGDATKDDCLEAAGIRRAAGLAAALSVDADNLFLVLTARSMNPDLRIATRVIDEEATPKLRQAGADHTVSTNYTSAVRLTATLLRPSVASFLDATTLAGDKQLRLEELQVSAGSRLAGQTLAQARIPQETGLIVLGIKRENETELALFNPGPDTRLEPGDTMIVLGRMDQLAGLRQFSGA